MAENATAKSDVVHGDVLEVLRLVEKGDLVFEASQEMEKVVQGIRETGKGGTLTIKLNIAPIKQGSNAWNVTGDVSSKIPKPPRGGSVFYPTDRNTLQRDDPRQTRMQFDD